MATSYYLLNSILTGVLRGPSTSSPGSSLTQPSATYVGLYTAAPAPTGGGTEVSGNGYARQKGNFAAPSNGAIASNADITFPQASGAWGTIIYFGVFDSLAGGNLLYFAPLTSSRSVLTGDTVKFPSGQLTVTGT
jgi:hypothetical protein